MTDDDFDRFKARAAGSSHAIVAGVGGVDGADKGRSQGRSNGTGGAKPKPAGASAASQQLPRLSLPPRFGGGSSKSSGTTNPMFGVEIGTPSSDNPFVEPEIPASQSNPFVDHYDDGSDDEIV